MTYTDDLAQEGSMTPPGDGPESVERQDFWANTCRDVTEMHNPSPEAIALYRRYGCRFCVPGRQHVQDVLSALDAAMPHWEKEHPELFYQTLELNYPELVRRS